MFLSLVILHINKYLRHVNHDIWDLEPTLHDVVTNEATLKHGVFAVDDDGRLKK